jgi:hypothetical protein
VVGTVATGLLVVGVSASIGGAAPVTGTGATNRTGPDLAAVTHQRFTTTFRLDSGVVTIRPAPARTHPTMGETRATTQIWATAQIMGYRPLAIGFGVVTIDKRVAGVPPVRNLPAWVGLASAASFNCPMMRTSPTRPTPPLPTPGDAAVVVGEAIGGPAVVYRARSVPCGSVLPATLTNAVERVSIPWSALGPVESGVLTVRFAVPACAGIGGIATGGTAAAMTVTVYVLIPESPVAMSCAPGHQMTETVDLGPGNIPGAPPPLATSTTKILHGQTGPARVVGAQP